MSIHKSYFSRNNTIIFNSLTNTGRNPVVELFYGGVDDVITPKGFSRFIFDINISDLQNKIQTGLISTGCSRTITHKLKMTNTSSFDEGLLNETWSNGRRRATSFDLILFRIPENQQWDEGVGYDYYPFTNSNSSTASFGGNLPVGDKSYSNRPSNWFKPQTISNWSTPGLYDNTNTGTGSTVNYSGLTIIDIQHFEFGNENIEFDMTNEINSILTGSTTGVTGWGIAYVPEIENITGLTENYSVGFFSRHTQTFYEPYLETTYDDLIEDDRNIFTEQKLNKLYLYAYSFGNPINFDIPPVVTILDQNGDEIDGYQFLETCKITEGIYEVQISGLTTPNGSPCVYYDVWESLIIDGIEINPVENQFVINPLSDFYQIGSLTSEPSLYGFDFSGIKQDEKIINTDIRKVNVLIKKAYTSNQLLNKVQVYYRIYVKEGTTEVEVQEWTKINRTPDSYYFVFDTRDKIPNEYFIDIKVITDRETDTYKKQIKFQIVNQK